MKSKKKNNKLKNKDGITQLYDTATNTTSSAAAAVPPDGIDVMMTTNEIWANLKHFRCLQYDNIRPQFIDFYNLFYVHRKQI